MTDIYLVDDDIDQTKSVFNQLVTSKKGAFSTPTIVCQLIDNYPSDYVIHVVLNTSGGSLSHCEKILKKLRKHKAGYIAYIRGECYSAGAIIALGAKEIVMNCDSYIGKIDPQVASDKGCDQLAIYAKLHPTHITDHTIYKHTEAMYVFNYTEKLLDYIYSGNSSCRTKIMDNLLYSKLPHAALFDSEECGNMGLCVRVPNTEEKEKYFTPSKLNIQKHQRIKEGKTSYHKYMVIAVGILSILVYKYR